MGAGRLCLSFEVVVVRQNFSREPRRSACWWSSRCVLGVTGSMLAATGIFGMAAYSISKRLRELGIRMPVPGELNRGKLSMQCNM
jgi:hypothetical protein